MGVNIDRVVVLTFLLGGIWPAGPGLLYGSSSRRPATTSGSCPASRRSPRPCSAASATSAGALLGGLLLGLLENYGAAVFGGEWKDVFAFVVLVLVLMFRPSGLLGETPRGAEHERPTPE